MSFTDIRVEHYNKGSFMVCGNTIKYKDDLKQLGGKYNGTLKSWCFQSEFEEKIKNYIKNGKKLESEEYNESKEDIIIKLLHNIIKKIDNLGKVSKENVYEIDDDNDEEVPVVIKRLLR